MTTRKLGRKKENRERTLRNLATSLVLYEKVRTTEAKAKALVPLVERLLSRARRGDLAARRSAQALLFDGSAVAKLFEDVANNRQGDRTSGFVRITRLAARPGDGSAMAQLELLFTPIEEVIEKQSKTKVSVRRPAAKKETAAEAGPAEAKEEKETV